MLTLCHLAKTPTASIWRVLWQPSSSSQARLQSSLAFFGAHTLEVPKIALSKWIWWEECIQDISRRPYIINIIFFQKTPSCHPCQVEFNRIFVCLQLILGKLFFPAFSCGHCSILWFNPCVTVMTSSMPLPTPTANGAQAWGKLTAEGDHKIRWTVDR